MQAAAPSDDELFVRHSWAPLVRLGCVSPRCSWGGGGDRRFKQEIREEEKERKKEIMRLLHFQI